jgi:hypothetical protein
MKRMLLILGTAVLLLNTLVIPAAVRADGGGTGTTCSGSPTPCKP